MKLAECFHEFVHYSDSAVDAICSRRQKSRSQGNGLIIPAITITLRVLDIRRSVRSNFKSQLEMDLSQLVSAERCGIARTKDTSTTDADRCTRARTRKDARTRLAICNLAPSSLFTWNPIGDFSTIFVTRSCITHMERTGWFTKIRRI